MKLDLARHITAARMTQAAFAEAAGISPGFLSEIISGKKLPAIQKLDRFAEILGVPVSELLAKDVPMAASAGMSESEATPWQAPQKSTIQRAISAMSSGLDRPETYRAAISEPALSVRRGDILLVDMSAKPEPGSLVVATLADESTGASFTILRQWLPGWLIGGESPQAMATGGNSVAILGVVSALLREA